MKATIKARMAQSEASWRDAGGASSTHKYTVLMDEAEVEQVARYLAGLVSLKMMSTILSSRCSIVSTMLSSRSSVVIIIIKTQYII